ncbi:hypothetical protein VTO42DRAFT_1338 [Malbranchea cinnamomea]
MAARPKMAALAGSDGKEHTNLYSLPNELLSSLLVPLATPELLPLTRVSHRFNALILRLLYHRLLAAAPLREYRLILECYHPSCKATEPYLVCMYCGTDEWAGEHGDKYSGADGLRRLRMLYSRFKPQKKDDGQREGRDARATQIVMLDDFESFSQLCVSANILGRGAFTTCVTLADGIVRLWREWLTQQAHLVDAPNIPEENSDRDCPFTASESSRIVWVDPAKTIGLKLRVTDVTKESDQPVLMQVDEEVTTKYEIEFEELLVRTTRLLMAVEEARKADVAPKAIIFGTIQMNSLQQG